MKRAVPGIHKLTTLLHLASPALPIGEFSYSQGLEAVVDARIVHDAATTRHWIEGGLRHVLAVNELPMLALLLRHWEISDFSGLQRLNAVFLASRETSELRRETEQMDWSLSQLATRLGWSDQTRRTQLTRFKPIGLPAAFAFAAVGLGIDHESGLAAYAFTWVENQVAAVVKAVPLGQIAGQKILFVMHALSQRLCSAPWPSRLMKSALSRRTLEFLQPGMKINIRGSFDPETPGNLTRQSAREISRLRVMPLCFSDPHSVIVSEQR